MKFYKTFMKKFICMFALFLGFASSLNAAQRVDHFDLGTLIKEGGGDLTISSSEVEQFADQLRSDYGISISYLAPGNSDLSEVVGLRIRDIDMVIPFGIIQRGLARRPLRLIYLQLLYIDESLSRIQDKSKYHGLEFVIISDSEKFSEAFDIIPDSVIALVNTDTTWACIELFNMWKDVFSFVFSPAIKSVGEAMAENVGEGIGIIFMGGFLGILQVVNTVSCVVGDSVRLISRPTGLSNPPKVAYIFTPDEISAIVEREPRSSFLDAATP